MGFFLCLAAHWHFTGSGCTWAFLSTGGSLLRLGGKSYECVIDIQELCVASQPLALQKIIDRYNNRKYGADFFGPSHR